MDLNITDAKHIIIVDDDQEMHDLYVGAITELNLLTQIHHTYDGAQGLEKYQALATDGTRPALVIMDGQMPVMNGYDTIAAIIEGDTDANIILMSWAPDSYEAERNGAAAAYTKTYEQDTLRERLATHILAADGDDLEDSTDTNDGDIESSEAPEKSSPATWTGDDDFPPIPVEAADAEEEAEEVEVIPETYEEKKLRIRAETIAGVRQLCDILEADPTFPMPYAFTDGGTVYINTVDTEEGDKDLVDTIRRLRRAMKLPPGEWLKEYDSYAFKMSRRLGGDDGFKFQFYASRSDVCERVVVGKHEVTEEIPDPDLVAEVPLKKVTRTVEEVQWVCPEKLVSG